MKLVTQGRQIDFAFAYATELHAAGRHADSAHVLRVLQTAAALTSVHSTHEVLPFRHAHETDEEYRARFDAALGLEPLPRTAPVPAKPTPAPGASARPQSSACWSFSGASDDLIEVDVLRMDGGKIAEEYDALKSRWVGDLVHPEQGKMRVTGWYDTTGSWHFGVGQVDEDTPIPGWTVHIVQHPETAYSVQLSVFVPAGTDLVVDGVE